MTLQRLRVGAVGEELAADHLQDRGFTVLDRNYRSKFGELDIVAGNRSRIVFVEVKTRTRTGHELSPMLSVGGRKQTQVRRVAQQWLMLNSWRSGARELRFDVIGITLDTDGAVVLLEHIEAAF